MYKNINNIAVSFFVKNKVCVIWKYYGCLFQSTLYRNGASLEEDNIEYQTPVYTSLEEAYRDIFLKISLPKVA